MFKFEPRDEGLLAVTQDGHSAAHIETRIVGETADPNLRVQKRTVKSLPQEQWRVHFTGYKFSPAEVQVFAEELFAQEG